MRWQDDPLLVEAQTEREAHGKVVRSAILWTPPAAVLIGLLVFFTFDRVTGPSHGGTWFLVVVLALLSFLFGFQALQPIRDMFAGPREITGVVTRRWSRSDSLVLKSHYIRLEDGSIFHLEPLVHADVKEGDHLRIRHFPHSARVISVTKEDLPGEAANEGDVLA